MALPDGNIKQIKQRFAKIRRNIGSLVSQGAGDDVIDRYILSENVTRDQLADSLPIPGGDQPAEQQPESTDGFRLTVPQEITLPDGTVKTIDVLSPESKRVAVEGALSTLGAMIPLPGTSAATQILIRSIMSGVGGGTGSLASETFDPSQDPLKRAGITAGVSAIGEGIGGAIVAGGQRLLASPSQVMKPGAVRSNELLAQQGQQLLPAQATTSFATDLIQTGGESSILAGGVLRSAKENVRSAAQDMIEQFGRGLGSGSRETGGELIADTLSNARTAQTEAVRQAYAAIDDTGAIGVDITPIKQFVQKRLAPEAGFNPEGITERMREMLDRPDVISFAEASSRRSAFGSVASTPIEQFPGEAKGVATKLFALIDDQMEVAGKELAPEILQQWRSATALSKMNHSTFNNKLIRSFLKEQPPEKVFDSAIRNAEPTAIRRVREIMLTVRGGGSKWRDIQGLWVNDLLERSVKDDVVSGAALSRAVHKIGGERLTEIFPGKSTRDKFIDLVRVMKLADSDPDSGAFKMAFRFGQLGGVAGGVASLTMGVPGLAAASAILLTPAVLAFLVKSRLGQKLLVTGFGAPPGSALATRAFNRLGAILLKENLIKEFSPQVVPSERVTATI